MECRVVFAYMFPYTVTLMHGTLCDSTSILNSEQSFPVEHLHVFMIHLYDAQVEY